MTKTTIFEEQQIKFVYFFFFFVCFNFQLFDVTQHKISATAIIKILAS